MVEERSTIAEISYLTRIRIKLG